MKRVLITGASRGIGRACAIECAKNGYEVIFTYNKSEKDAMSLKNEIEKYSVCEAYKIDFSDFDKFQGLFNKIISKYDRFDALINNAAISEWGIVQDVTEEKYDSLMNVNLKAMFFLTKVVSKIMTNNMSGSIVNIGSIWGETGASCEVLYSCSKAGVIGFSKALAKELAPMNVRVNSVSPGVVDTDMMNRFTFEEKEEICSEIPLGRFAQPVEIAKLVLFLIGDDSNYITGQDIAINGGMYC